MTKRVQTERKQARETNVERVGVVGAGMMGAGIVEICARAGSDVLVVEVSDDAVHAARRRLDDSLTWGERSGKLSAAVRSLIVERIRFTLDVKELADRDLVIESAVEDRATKRELFTVLDDVLGGEAIIASNTSSIPIVTLAKATRRPEQVVGFHFFNPVPIQPLVELVRSLLTSDLTMDRCRQYATEGLGKQVIVSKDRSGFVVNVLLVPYLLSAIRLVESEFASAADIDTGMVLGAAHRMGPLAVADFIGIDTLLDVANVLYDEFKDPAMAPPQLLSRMVEAGFLGRKSGRGFHSYPPESRDD